jgi:phosphatidylserine/phosphatidylglycerophosphate/cardiolipin synthase-like enzyme
MAKFLVTSGVTYKLEELIKGTEDRLILISPYLQFSKRIKDNIASLNILKRDIRIIYRENKLQVEESNWLEGQVGVRTSICSTLHAKCYLNEKEAIVTSMNLYTYSQENNDEMGIYVTKKEDPDLYEEISNEAQRLLRISDEIRVSVKKVDKEIEKKTDKTISEITKTKKKSNSKLLTTKELSQLTGLSSRKGNSWFTSNKLMYKKDEDWITTKKGKEIGGIEKSGQYGKFVVWPEEVSSHLN